MAMGNKSNDVWHIRIHERRHKTVPMSASVLSSVSLNVLVLNILYLQADAGNEAPRSQAASRSQPRRRESPHACPSAVPYVWTHLLGSWGSPAPAAAATTIRRVRPPSIWPSVRGQTAMRSRTRMTRAQGRVTRMKRQQLPGESESVSRPLENLRSLLSAAA